MVTRTCQLFLLIAAFVCIPTAYAFESPSYEVIQKDGRFEIRQYETYLVAEIIVTGDAESAGDQAFPALAGYISGKNDQKEKISMTTPVNQVVGQSSQRVSFMMPTKWHLDTLPKPEDAEVTLKQMPARLVASLRYGGNWREDRFRDYEQRLRKILEDLPYKICSEPLWARYNPPFWPSMLRRNEVQFVISEGPCAAP